MGIGFTLKPLPHQNFDEMCDGIQKNKSTVHDEIFGGRAYTLQNNCALSQATAGYKTLRNLTVTEKNFVMKRLGVSKKYDGLCLMIKISKRLRGAKPPCEIL
jgi:hypothetical protein